MKATTTAECSSGGDTDYVIVYGYDSSNPNALRYSQANGSVEAVLLSYRADGSTWGSLKDFSNGANDVRVCIGSRIWAVGGPEVAFAHVYIR